MLGQPVQQWFLIGVAAGFILGLLVGFHIWHKRRTNKDGEKRLTQIQMVGICIFILYIASPLVNLPKPDSVIAIAILSLVAGENIGVAFAKLLEKTPYVDRSKK